LRAALENSDPLHAELIGTETAAPLGPLIGIYSAIWIALRTQGRPLIFKRRIIR
jgi:hypothetical protein